MKEKLKVTVIFPMAGKGSRFGYKFKPFLKIGDSTFIQRAVNSFDKCTSSIKEFIFIYLAEQEKEHNVSNKLKEMFPYLNYRTVILDKETKGPAETVREAIKKDGNIKGEVIICDSDHYVDVEPIFKYLEDGNSEKCIIPVWNLMGEDLKSWSVAALSDEGYVKDIAEKELPKSPGSFFGVIGCYYFKDPEIIIDDKIYISEIIKDLIKKRENVKGVHIRNAEFFGDPQRLQNTLDVRAKKKGAIFCDLDGTLIEHEDIPNYAHPIKVLPKTLDKLRQWSKDGYTLILTTSRKSSSKEELISLLKEAGIEYEDLIMDLPSGPRYLINDRKPSAILTPNSIAFEVERNKGIGDLEIDSVKPNILKMFKGGSLSKTILVEKSGKLFVRRVVSKENSLLPKYSKLKKQFYDMERLSKLCKEIFPELYGQAENHFEYYYDMEFLADYNLLMNCPNSTKLQAIKLLLNKMKEKIYKPGSYILGSGIDWMEKHFSEKIYPKLKEEKLTPKLFYLVNSDKVIIDGKQYSGLFHLLKKSLEQPYINLLKPSYLCPVHGDLTFENILYRDNYYDLAANSYKNSIKLIDTDCIDFIDPPEIDLGKMFQSIISQYESWSSKSEPLIAINNKEVNLKFVPDKDLLKDLSNYVSFWEDIINGSAKEVEIKGRFYMALHLIRMIPFRMSVSEDQAIFALASAIKELSLVLDMIKDLQSQKSSDNISLSKKIPGNVKENYNL